MENKRIALPANRIICLDFSVLMVFDSGSKYWLNTFLSIWITNKSVENPTNPAAPKTAKFIPFQARPSLPAKSRPRDRRTVFGRLPNMMKSRGVILASLFHQKYKKTILSNPRNQVKAIMVSLSKIIFFLLYSKCAIG